MKKCLLFLSVLFGLFTQTNFCTAQIMTTLAGTGLVGFSGDGGAATAAELKTPSGVAVDKTGNVYITDQNCSCVRKVDRAGIITSVVGNSGVAGYHGDGGQATAAELYWPEGLAIDDTGNLFIADQFNNVIREVNSATGIISTIAGNNALIGFSGDGGPATNAALWHPGDVGVDNRGNVYFVDEDNSVMRKVNLASGIITTMAGTDTAGYSGDGGQATAAKLNFPQGIALDSAGNIFIADFYNSRIRKINAATGIITTVAGNGTAGFSGDGSPATDAELYDASALALDHSGNIYISDYYNSRIRKVNAATGFISTVAGDSIAAYCCDCNIATAAEINFPQGVAVDTFGNVYIADFSNARVRKVTDSFYCPALATRPQLLQPALKIFPNPAQGQFCFQVSNIQTNGKAEIYNTFGNKVYEADIHELQMNINLSGLPAGVYTLHLVSQENNVVQKIVISN